MAPSLPTLRLRRSSRSPSPGFSPGSGRPESLRIGEVGFPEPAPHSCLAPVAPGSMRTVEMSPTGININKKQMNLRRGLLSINQAARPLTANTVQVGPGQTFSWPPPGLTAAPPPPPPTPRPFSKSLWNKFWTGRGHSPGSGDPAGSVAFGGFLASRYQRVRVAQHTTLPESWARRPRLPVPGAAPAGGCALQPLPALAASLVWWTPSGIFNWKLISSHLNRRPRQRRGTHPPAQPRPPTPTWDEERRESGCAVL